DREFDYSEVITDHCGSCTRCLDACPTGALTSEYEIDAGKCISYLTIENKGGIDAGLKGKFAGYIFGCDICQDVCPWNKKFETETGETSFTPINKEIKFADAENMTAGEFKKKFKDSPVLRAKLKGIQRNAAFLKGD
ncbi:MAG TPA: 4Fe-4S double cluster binding domain-containing protein, partial [Ignavibacteriales bacterium]|nr:4Fe-4S double cluster binding domain-containing protein [Ignavibacteriales bacterium]